MQKRVKRSLLILILLNFKNGLSRFKKNGILKNKKFLKKLKWRCYRLKPEKPILTNWLNFLGKEKKALNSFFYFLFYFLTSFLGWSETLSFNLFIIPSRPVKTQFKVGDRLKLRIEKSQFLPEKFEIALQDPEEKKKLIELGWLVQPGSILENQEKTLIATPLKGGHLAFPSLKLMDPKTNVELAILNPFSVEILSSLGDPPKNPRALKFPVALEIPIWLWLIFIIFGILISSFLIFLIYKFLKKKKSIKQQPSFVPNKTPEQIAFEGLEKLESQQLWLKKKFKLHYFELSEILKAYITRQFQVDAMNSTSEEFLSELKKWEKLNSHMFYQLGSLLERLDLV